MPPYHYLSTVIGAIPLQIRDVGWLSRRFCSSPLAAAKAMALARFLSASELTRCMRDPRWDNAGTRRRCHAQLQTTEKEGWSEQVEKAQGHEVIDRSTADPTRAFLSPWTLPERMGRSSRQTMSLTGLSKRLVLS